MRPVAALAWLPDTFWLTCAGFRLDPSPERQKSSMADKCRGLTLLLLAACLLADSKALHHLLVVSLSRWFPLQGGLLKYGV